MSCCCSSDCCCSNYPAYPASLPLTATKTGNATGPPGVLGVAALIDIWIPTGTVFTYHLSCPGRYFGQSVAWPTGYCVQAVPFGWFVSEIYCLGGQVWGWWGLTSIDPTGPGGYPYPGGFPFAYSFIGWNNGGGVTNGPVRNVFGDCSAVGGDAFFSGEFPGPYPADVSFPAVFA